MKLKLYPISIFFQKPFIRITVALSVLTNLLVWLWLIIQFPPTSDTVFLHYDTLFGINLVGPWWRLMMMPLAGLVILLLNTLVGWLLYAEDKFIAHVCLVVAVIVQLLLLPATYVLLFLNV